MKAQEKISRILQLSKLSKFFKKNLFEDILTKETKTISISYHVFFKFNIMKYLKLFTETL